MSRLAQAKLANWRYPPRRAPTNVSILRAASRDVCDARLTRIQETRVTSSVVTADTLAEFSDAFNRHDANALMDFMTEDCVFDAATGLDVHGKRFVGREAVRAAFEAVFETFPDAHWGHGRHYVASERGVSEWVFTGTHAQGWRIEAEGCDLFEFRDGLIAVKRAFRKERPKQPADGAAPCASTAF